LWFGGALSALALCCAIDETRAAEQVRLRADGSIQMSGRSLKCGTVRNVLDARLPNLGISVPGNGLLVINPVLIARYPAIVRLFVFHHECGHHHVGASELDADCWAVRRGVQGGWLSRAGLQQVCNSFRGEPTTLTHPSGNARCSNLDRCFASAIAERTAPVKAPAASSAAAFMPNLESAPESVRQSASRRSRTNAR
jgi:hypothetical protein